MIFGSIPHHPNAEALFVADWQTAEPETHNDVVSSHDLLLKSKLRQNFSNWQWDRQ